MRFIILSMCSFVILPSCDLRVFAPRVNNEIVRDLTLATDGLARINACIELETCAGRAEFAKVEQDYVDSFALVAQARLRAGQLETTTKYTDQAKELFVEELAECQNAIKRMALAHRSTPSLAGAGIAAPTVVICSLARDAAHSLN